MFTRKPSRKQKIDTLVDARTRINGDVEFAGGFHLDGTINGNVSGEPGAQSFLWVGEKGTIEGSVMVSNIVLNGLVRGDIDATGRVELGEKARVLGSVRYLVIETAVGAQINGKLEHRGTPGAGDHDADSPEGAPPL
jgi:cytoskeletal protein CcmA (bactofilin family)